MMTGFSVLPLADRQPAGITFGVLGMLVLTYVVGRYFIAGSAVPGFTFIASIVAIFSGVQPFALGIFGEYLARMHFRSMERPPYTLLHETPTQETGAPSAALFLSPCQPALKPPPDRSAGHIDTPALQLYRVPADNQGGE